MKSVLITGGAKRIGRSLTAYFSEMGWKVFIHCNASMSDAEKLQKQILADGGQAEVIAVDLSDAGKLTKSFQDLFAKEKVDCVINNASAFEYDQPTEIDEAVFQKSLAVNLFAPTKISELYYKAEIQTSGCVINILDNKVFALNPDFYSYTLAKSALLAATKMMAMSFAPGIRVCGIAPSITLPSGKQTQEDFEKTHRLNLLGVGCTPEEICRAAMFIATTASFNGQVLTIDGGQSLMNLERDVAFLDQ